jgi:hypothetical protein
MAPPPKTSYLQRRTDAEISAALKKKMEEDARRELAGFGFTEAEEAAFVTRSAADYAIAVREVEMTPALRSKIAALDSQRASSLRRAVAALEKLPSMWSKMQTAEFGNPLFTGFNAASIAMMASLRLSLVERHSREFEARRKALICAEWKLQQIEAKKGR